MPSSGASAASNGPGRSGEAHAENGHPNPDAVRGHDEEGKRGKGHESHGNGHGYGHGDHHGGEEFVIIDEPAADQPNIDQPVQDEPKVDQPNIDQLNESDPVETIVPGVGGASGDGMVVSNDEPTVANQSKSLGSVVDNGAATSSVAPVEIRSADDVLEVSAASPLADGSTDGVILRFR